MKMKEFIERFDKLSVYEKRAATDDYYELVFYAKDTLEWEKILTDILGPGMTPPPPKLSKEDVRLAAGYGGVQDGQTFFKKEIGTSVIMALVWPWQDADHTTLKIVLNESAPDNKR